MEVDDNKQTNKQTDRQTHCSKFSSCHDSLPVQSTVCPFFARLQIRSENTQINNVGLLENWEIQKEDRKYKSKRKLIIKYYTPISFAVTNSSG
jgi:hypothetical protein